MHQRVATWIGCCLFLPAFIISSKDPGTACLVFILGSIMIMVNECIIYLDAGKTR